MDLVRQDTRNAWNSAGFAITHGVGNNHQIREEMEKLLAMISGVQRQQQILTSQVEELRRNAAEKDAGSPPVQSQLNPSMPPSTLIAWPLTVAPKGLHK